MGYVVFRQMPKDGTPGFRLGWKHGCESGLGSHFGGAIYMTFYSWSKDPDIASVQPNVDRVRLKYPEELKGINWNDPEEVKDNFAHYREIFWKAHIFCRHSVLGILQTAGMDPPLAGSEARYDPAKHHLGSIWKIDGKGDTRYGASTGGGGLW